MNARALRIVYDKNGLPFVLWSEGSALLRYVRTCRVMRGHEAGQFLFVHESVEEAGGIYGVFVGVAAAVAALATIFGLSFLVFGVIMGLRPSELPEIVNFLWLAAIAIGIFVGRKAGPWLAERGYGSKVDRQTAPWHDLSAFTLTDDQAHFGRPRVKNGQTVEPKLVILAHVGSELSPICVSHDDWSASRAADIHSRLTHEFIDRRAEHVQRLNVAERAARNESAAQRHKVV